MQYNAIQYTTLHYTTLPYNTIQYNTIQYNTIQYNTIQYNTIQYNTIPLLLATAVSISSHALGTTPRIPSDPLYEIIRIKSQLIVNNS